LIATNSSPYADDSSDGRYDPGTQQRQITWVVQYRRV
jgi:hypothetical protein